jgi:lipopolysaccharide/colanic/teichoic acid biosynthesis glycosyltransferase
MLIVAILIKLTSRGPVLFQQERLGFLGKPFTFMKFRSMKMDSDESIHQNYVTKLINGQHKIINKGTEKQPLECDIYRRWHCRRVLEMKPGITGLWQVSGRSSTTFDEMVRLDLNYIRNWSLWLDFKIILKTFWAVVSTRGGY